ncbi:sialidase family protein [Phytohabitans kaempferiae]|uniref:Sialidase family protein n=1 Tax=Phytohabitans kaempferiae TaxID=1620943 RepID=A0ABV6LUL5_9ACTN
MSGGRCSVRRPGAGGEVVDVRMLVPATRAEPRHSEASWLVLPGRTVLAWSAFAAAPDVVVPDTAVGREWRYSRDNNPAEIRFLESLDGGSTWGEPKVLVPNTAGINTMQPSLLAVDDHTIGLSYSVRESPAAARRLFRRSTDGGSTWTDPVDMTGIAGYVTASHHRMLKLASGRLVQPCHQVAGDVAEVVITVSDDGGATWHVTARIALAGRRAGHLSGLWESSVVEVEGGELLLAGRSALGDVYGSRSTDGGQTWSLPVPLGVGAPSAPSVLLAAGGYLLLLHNAGFDPDARMSGPRNTLVASISADGGHTWRRGPTLHAHDQLWYHYPAWTLVDGWVLLAFSITDPETRRWDLATETLSLRELLGPSADRVTMPLPSGQGR